MEPEQFIEGISRELNAALDAMQNTTSLEEKQQYSEIVKNLTNSLTTLLDTMGSFMHMEEDLFDMDEDSQKNSL